MLAGSDRPLTRVHDVAMLDLDGVVYVGRDAVPGAARHLSAARADGMRTAFITNNAARPPDVVAEHLTGLGVPATPDDVVTSAQAAAGLVRERHGAGSPVVRLGGPGVAAALEQAGLRPVGVEDDAVAVVTGYGPDVLWRDIMRVAVRVRDGLPWVACNADLTIPTPFGVAPGHGVLVETLTRFSGVVPDVAGKPQRPLLDETVRRMAAERPLMVGDRLDTDIEGAHAAGMDSLLVLTGVSGLSDLVAAVPAHRPTYLAPDLAGLLEPHPAPVPQDGGWRVGGWRAAVSEGRLEVAGHGGPGDWWRAVAAASWHHHDRTGEVADATGLVLPGQPALDR